MTARPIELLAPARDLACGLEAVRHGADAVYIGAPKFSARAVAGNTVDDIGRLCDFAHPFNVRVYVALNTILGDGELAEAETLIRRLYRAGADALIVQDMGITQLDLPPLPLHVSTQADNRTPEKIAFWHDAGFVRAVLARELSLEEIRAIAEHTPMELEAFVHGALCTGYSGRCYLSAALCGRSANRGECAQYCRLPYTLTDAGGQVLLEGRHLLSLRDLNRSDELEAMMSAGISSFKIEGRLKDVSYVKNITAFYRRKLDAVFVRNRAFCRASAGTSVFSFEPRPEKSFNRGFTSGFLHGRISEVTSFDTPKSIGEPLGTVKTQQGRSFTLENGSDPVHNGDGLVFINSRGELEGFRVNRVDGERIYPLKMPPSLRPGTSLRRNRDSAFEEQLAGPSAERKLSIELAFSDTAFGFSLAATDETGARAVVVRPFGKAPAQRPPEENIRTQLSRWGNTSFRSGEIRVSLSQPWFVPSSLLGGMRREVAEKLEQVRRMRYPRAWVKRNVYDTPAPCPARRLDYTANIANARAAAFYATHGVEAAEPAFELASRRDVPLMYAKHCLRYSLGWCPVHHNRQPPCREPLFLIHGQTRLRLQFDCGKCRMLVLMENGGMPFAKDSCRNRGFIPTCPLDASAVER
ncbi:MAG: U32 family peptidase [Tannerella sp.]|jgi:putative protease|nr:U32 family peptidase [Tannerella sp.]